jgi:hypothetical protein
MPHVYPEVRELEGKNKLGDGNCVALVQALTNVGHTSTWRPGERVMDAITIIPGTVIATFENGRYPNRPTGNHAALYLYSGPRDQKTGQPQYIVVMDQWTRKPRISARSIYPRGTKLHAQGNRIDDSDNAEHFYIVR